MNLNQSVENIFVPWGEPTEEKSHCELNYIANAILARFAVENAKAESCYGLWMEFRPELERYFSLQYAVNTTSKENPTDEATYLFAIHNRVTAEAESVLNERTDATKTAMGIMGSNDGFDFSADALANKLASVIYDYKSYLMFNGYGFDEDVHKKLGDLCCGLYSECALKTKDPNVRERLSTIYFGSFTMKMGKIYANNNSVRQ